MMRRVWNWLIGRWIGQRSIRMIITAAPPDEAFRERVELPERRLREMGLLAEDDQSTPSRSEEQPQ